MENPESHEDVLARALIVARLRALRTHLLALHKVLIDTERARYELDHGRIESPQAALQLVMRDPWFQWLHPLLAVIVQIDERLADKLPITDSEAGMFIEQARGLLQRESDPVFAADYRRSLQDAPEVVVAHARVVKVLVNDMS